VPRLALDTPAPGGRTLREVAREALAIARAGLDARGHGEAAYLAPLETIVESGRTQAQAMLDLYHGTWGESVLPAFRERVFSALTLR
jgi:glutamate--cysteine ligase